MVTETAAITAIFCVLALILRPGAATGIMIVSMLIWPEYLRIPMGVVQMSAPRLVAFVLIARFFIAGRHKKANMGMIDLFVFLGWAWTVLATVLSGSHFSLVTSKIGVGLDTVLIYFAARLALLTINDLKSLAWPLMLTALYMGTFGIYEAITGTSPYHKLLNYVTWDVRLKLNRFRLGLARAHVSMLIHIYFGLAMFLVTAMIWCLRDFYRQKPIFVVGMIISVLGTMSSMSSGPWIALFSFFFFTGFALNTKFIRYALWGMLVVMLGLELASNRHFYSLVDYLALNSGTAWYRTRLLEVAVLNIRDYWLIGSGGMSLAHWAAMIDGRPLVDVVNHYIYVALSGGLLALFFYGGAHFIAVKRAIKKWKATPHKAYRRLVFSVISMVLALDLAVMSVGLFGPPLLLSNVALAILVNVGLLNIMPQAQKKPQTITPDKARAAL
ncbi:MAG: hypothetical protein MI743_06380 [Sneathiellales bacterium]|nr:hypothetical protein [Sneathiellales bacterium]